MSICGTIEKDSDNCAKAKENELREQIEELKQELYAASIKYNSKVAVEKDAIEEIEELQRVIENEIQNKRNDIFKFEEETKKKEKFWKNEIENIKAEYEEHTQIHESKVSCLEKELSQSKMLAQSEGDKLKENLNHLAEVVALEVEKREKAEASAELLGDNFRAAQERLAAVEERLQFKEAEVENLKEKLTSAVEEAALYCSEMQEVKGSLRNGMESKPMDPSLKGNSLFAEVDDRRQVMKQQLLVERKKYSNLQRAFQVKCSHVQNLEAQLIDVSRKWKEDTKETSSSQNELLISFKTRIKYLEDAIKKLQNQMNELSIDEASSRRMNPEPLSEYKYIEMDLEKERRENKELREKLDCFSLEKMIQDEEMYNLKGHLRRLKAENAYLSKIAIENEGRDAEVKGVKS